MPLVQGKDKNGNFFKWGRHGHKYYYPSGNEFLKMEARWRALRQGRAVEMHYNYARNF
jgi:hypothetical protein